MQKIISIDQLIAGGTGVVKFQEFCGWFHLWRLSGLKSRKYNQLFFFRRVKAAAFRKEMGSYWENVILRIRLFDESATYTFPLLSTATPEGPLKLAEVPFPSP